MKHPKLKIGDKVRVRRRAATVTDSVDTFAGGQWLWLDFGDGKHVGPLQPADIDGRRPREYRPRKNFSIWGGN